jgi:membrane-bound ClpP family serine protease
MGLAGIITLIVLGIILIFLEFFVVPGITVAGIGGLILLVLGIYFSYSSYGVATGNALLLTTFGALGLIFYVAYKTGAWKKNNFKYRGKKHFEGRRFIECKSWRYRENSFKTGTYGNYYDK